MAVALYGFWTAATVITVGSTYGVGELVHDFGDWVGWWKRDVDPQPAHALFYVTNADNVTMADMRVLRGMNVAGTRQHNEDHYSVTFANDAMGWNKTGVMEWNQDHVIDGIAHGRFHIDLERDGAVNPEGLWVHMSKHASKEHVEAARDLQEVLDTSLNDKAQHVLDDIIEMTAKTDGN